MDDERGRTIVVPYCDLCPPLPAWPRKNLILGNCPNCGRFNAQAWRLAAALRLATDPNKPRRADT